MSSIKARSPFVLADLDLTRLTALLAPLTLKALHRDGNEFEVFFVEALTEAQKAEVLKKLNLHLASNILYAYP